MNKSTWTWDDYPHKVNKFPSAEKKKGGKVMSFLKKLGETVKDTASSVSAKSIDLMETGKLKMKKSQLEGGVKDKKIEIGELVYQAHKQEVTPDEFALNGIFEEIKELENQISVVEEKLRKEGAQAEEIEEASQSEAEVPVEADDVTKVFCAYCGQESSSESEARFCTNCGKPISGR